ncbi:Coiled-coil and C2 domain-containing protein 2A [Rhizophlyctis rosea]|uniref:Coiled-coil and C2 domain-containing protein 2A n=1 Tax=Rhizophlyctis rosea TaxID=64517 RepID=A0AAD5SC51_9FUNG|nr:Coiled-coil and C2 domain-containing protein 2A [Rhizophlyctis rosea]
MDPERRQGQVAHEEGNGSATSEHLSALERAKARVNHRREQRVSGSDISGDDRSERNGGLVGRGEKIDGVGVMGSVKPPAIRTDFARPKIPTSEITPPTTATTATRYHRRLLSSRTSLPPTTLSTPTLLTTPLDPATPNTAATTPRRHRTRRPATNLGSSTSMGPPSSAGGDASISMEGVTAAIGAGRRWREVVRERRTGGRADLPRGGSLPPMSEFPNTSPRHSSASSSSSSSTSSESDVASEKPKRKSESGEPAGDTTAAEVRTDTDHAKRKGSKKAKKRRKRRVEEGEELLSGVVEVDERRRRKKDKGKRRDEKAERERRERRKRRKERREKREREGKAAETDVDREDEFRRIVAKADADMIGTYVMLGKWEQVWKDIVDRESHALGYPEFFDDRYDGSLWGSAFEVMRRPEDEGLYEGEQPEVTYSNYKKMVNRLKMTEPDHGKDWFTFANRLNALPSPLTPFYKRPLPITPISPLHPVLTRQKALPLTPYHPVTDHPTGTYYLLLDLRNLQIDSHPLMNQEASLTRDIESLVSSLKQRKQARIVEYLDGKVEALRAAYLDYVRAHPLKSLGKEEEDKGDGIYDAKPVHGYYAKLAERDRVRREREGFEVEATRRAYLEDIRATRLLRDTESQHDLLLEFKILKLWETLKALRSTNQVTTTPLKLLIISSKSDISQDEITFQTALSEELEELRDMHELDQLREMREHEVQIKRWEEAVVEREYAMRRKVEEEEERKRRRREEREVETLIGDVDEEESEGEGVDGRFGKTVEVRKKEKKKGRKPKSDVDEGIGETEGDGTGTDKDGKEKKRGGLARSLSRAGRRKSRSRKEEIDATDDAGVETGTATEREGRSLLAKMKSRSRSKSHGKGKSTEEEDGGRKRSKSSVQRLKEEEKRKSGEQSGSGGMVGHDSVESVVSVPERPKEFAASEFNEKKARAKIKKRLDASRRQIGAPTLSITCAYTAAVTSTSDCPKIEQLRRNQLEATQIHARIFYNDKEVTRTKAVSLNLETLSAKFCGVDGGSKGKGKHLEEEIRAATVIGVEVREVPESIRIELHESNAYGEMLLGEAVVPIPEASDTAADLDRDPLELSFAGPPFDERAHSHPGLEDEGKSRSAASNDGVSKWISGRIVVSAVWGVDEEGRSLGPVQTRSKDFRKQFEESEAPILRSSGPLGLVNLRKVMDWINDIRLDVNDPRNQDILRLQKAVHAVADTDGPVTAENFRQHWVEGKFFRLGVPIWMEQAAVGIATDKSMEGKRLDLLMARHKREVTVQQPVPTQDDKINDEMFQKVEDRANEELGLTGSIYPKRSFTPTATTPLTPLDLSKDIPTTLDPGFLKRIRSHQLLSLARHSRPPHVDDYVREERLPDTPQREWMFLNVLKPRRPLRPHRVDVANNGRTAHPAECKIVVQVVRAFNLPVRKANSGIVDAAATGGKDTEQIVCDCGSYSHRFPEAC